MNSLLLNTPCPTPTEPQQWAHSLTRASMLNQCQRFDDDGLGQSRIAGRARRKLEFAQGRSCVHGLLREMGETQTVGVADDRSPIWPTGFTGSISHSRDWVWGCVGQQNKIRSIGIDTELIATPIQRADVQDTIATDAEWNLVRQFGLTQDEGFTLVFSAKEAFYKCWFPIVKTYFDFFDAEVVSITPSTLSLRALSTDAAFAAGPEVLTVHYLLNQDSVFTIAWMEQEG